MRRLVHGLAMLAIVVAGGFAVVVVAAPAPIVLPFVPPVGTPIRYAAVSTRAQGGATMTVRSTETLSFGPRTAAGFELAWVTSTIDVEGPPPMKGVLDKMFGLAVGQPLRFRLSPEGMPLELVNTAEVRALMDRMATSITADIATSFPDLPAEQRAPVAKMFENLIAQQRAISDEAFADQVLEEPSYLLRNIGPVQVGVPARFDVESPSPFGTGTIRIDGTSELRRYEPGKAAEVVIKSTIDPDDVKRLTKNAVTTALKAVLDPAERAKIVASIEQQGAMSVSDELVVLIDLPSGITRRATYRKVLARPGLPDQVQTREYTRID